MQTLDDEMSNNHDDIVKIVTTIGSRYEYTHQCFRNMSKNLRCFKYKFNNKLLEIYFAKQRNKMINKLYIDFVGSIVLIFNYCHTFILLPICTLK